MKLKKNIFFLKIFIFLGTIVLAFGSLSVTLGSNVLDEKLIPKATGNDEIVYGMSLPAGWSMISLPVMPNNVTVSSVFPEAVVLYGYKRGSGYIRIKKDEDLKIGIGYWIFLDEEKTYSLTGQFITGYELLIPDDGWYMIGGCTYPSQAISDKGTIVVIYGYDQGIGYKRITDQERLRAGAGFWISLSGVSRLNAVITTSTIEWTLHKTIDNAHPDENEQQMVWLMNKARSDPPGEGIWLTTTNHPDIAFARSFFKVDVNLLENEFTAYSAKPPTAFDVRLYLAAREHSEDLIRRDAQDHNNQFDLITSQGFSFSSARGNVFSYSKNSLHAHAAFNIDWYSGSVDGMFPGREHRKAIMSLDREYTNVGIAMISDSDPNTKAGPLVTSGNYCKAFVSAENHYNRFLVGTVWEDKNGNFIYDPGEGIPEVMVIPDHGTYHAITCNSGGYAIPIVSPGIYLVTFSGPLLNGKTFRTVEIGDESLLLDLTIE
ncbi:MAG: hypothetical protein ACMUIU_16735 [bacterium]